MLEANADLWLAEGSSYIGLSEQRRLMLASSELSRLDIQSKTLIETQTAHARHHLLDELVRRGPGPDTLRPSKTDERVAAAYGISVGEFLKQRVTEEVSREKLDVELLRFFADRVDGLVSAIEQLDNTDFSKLIPEKLIPLFRECHINMILGNIGTSAILCGVILERVLQDLLPSEKSGRPLIEEAKNAELLMGPHRSWAYSVIDLRNALAHGSKEFDCFTSCEAWATVTQTRRLISDLYSDRKENQ